MANYDQLLKTFNKDWEAFRKVRETFEEKERFLANKIYDSGTALTKSQVLDQTLMTALLRRTNDVMAKLPTGTVRVLSKKDKGKGLFLNLILEHYVLPNANSQADIYTKFWLTEFLSLVYGKVDLLVDWVVKEGYTGPDFFIIPPKLGFPEAGVISVNDASRYTVISYVSEEWLKSRKGLPQWKNIDKVLEVGKKNKAQDKDTSTTKEREEQEQYKDKIELITIYEPKKWTTFSRQAKVVLREIENPHGNDKLPIVSKVCYPMIDSYFGMSEYDRNITIQKTLNSMINLSLDGLKKLVVPHLKIYPPDIHMPSFNLSPGATWVLKSPNPNAITEHPQSALPVNAFEAIYGTIKGALLSSIGTTDTTIGAGVEPAMGKTPEALRMQRLFMASNTSFDRRMLEIAIEDVYDRFLDLLTHKQEADIELDLFGDEFKMIKEQYPDLLELYESGEGGKIRIKAKEIKNLSVKFYIDASSTMKQEEIVENQNLTQIITLLMNLPGFPEQIAQSGKARYGNMEVNFAELLKRFFATAGIEGWDKIVKELPKESLEMGGQGQPGQLGQQGQMPPTPPGGMPTGIEGQPAAEENPLVANLPEDQKQLFYELLGGR